ncbi:unnamed protein product [Polarella glacialis]|uniref:RING-type domain-containing protein n=1 Tax=Polarella glacialis TaxID=89957 RepID=A0A813GCB2_POLGL|nr:unnamed protein product [Polarella glacialis]
MASDEETETAPPPMGPVRPAAATVPPPGPPLDGPAAGPSPSGGDAEAEAEDSSLSAAAADGPSPPPLSAQERGAPAPQGLSMDLEAPRLVDRGELEVLDVSFSGRAQRRLARHAKRARLPVSISAQALVVEDCVDVEAVASEVWEAEPANDSERSPLPVSSGGEEEMESAASRRGGWRAVHGRRRQIQVGYAFGGTTTQSSSSSSLSWSSSASLSLSSSLSSSSDAQQAPASGGLRHRGLPPAPGLSFAVLSGSQRLANRMAARRSDGPPQLAAPSGAEDGGGGEWLEELLEPWDVESQSATAAAAAAAAAAARWAAVSASRSLPEALSSPDDSGIVPILEEYEMPVASREAGGLYGALLGSFSRYPLDAVAPSAAELNRPAQQAEPVLAAMYVELFRPSMEPRHCRFCHSPFSMGQLRLGYTPCGADFNGRQLPPVWIHALHCPRQCRLAFTPATERVGFSPAISAADKNRVLEELSHLSGRQTFPGTLQIRQWRYLPAVLQHWRLQPVPPRPQPAVLPAAAPAGHWLQRPSGPVLVPGSMGSQSLQVQQMLAQLMSEVAAPNSGSGPPPRGQGQVHRHWSGNIAAPPRPPPWPPPHPPPLLLPNHFHPWGAAFVVSRREEEEAAAREAALRSLLADVPVFKLTVASSEPCAVCREVMEVGELCRRLPCLHMFHQECIDRWLKVKATCPLDNLKLCDMMAEQRKMEAPDFSRRSPSPAPQAPQHPFARQRSRSRSRRRRSEASRSAGRRRASRSSGRRRRSPAGSRELASRHPAHGDRISVSVSVSPRRGSRRQRRRRSRSRSRSLAVQRALGAVEAARRNERAISPGDLRDTAQDARPPAASAAAAEGSASVPSRWVIGDASDSGSSSQVNGRVSFGWGITPRFTPPGPPLPPAAPGPPLPLEAPPPQVPQVPWGAMWPHL